MDKSDIPDSGESIAWEDAHTKNNTVEDTENIVFEGHGQHYPGEKWAVQQGGHTDDEMVDMTYNTVKNKATWNGKIILFGCSTGNLAVNVSRKAFKKFNRPIETLGLMRNVHFVTDKTDPDKKIPMYSYWSYVKI